MLKKIKVRPGNARTLWRKRADIPAKTRPRSGRNAQAFVFIFSNNNTE